MNPVIYIRKEVLGLSQEALAEIVGTTQPTVHRWEKEGRFPHSAQPKIRELGMAKGEWSDTWFFEVPND